MGIDQTPLLVQPVDFRLLWTDKGAGASQDGSIWRAVPPSNDYICLGDVPQSGYGKPRIADFACVHFCAVEQVSPLGPVWTTERTGARQNIAIYTLPVSNTFTVVDPGSTQAVFDLGQANQCADL